MKKRPITIVLLLTVALCLGMIASGGPAFAAGKTAYLPAKFTYKGDINMYMKYVWNDQGGLEKQIVGVNGKKEKEEITTENTYYPSGKVESQTRFLQGQVFETSYFTKAGKLEKKVLGMEGGEVTSVTTYEYNDRGYLHVEKETSSMSSGEAQTIRTVHKYKYHSNGKPMTRTGTRSVRRTASWERILPVIMIRQIS